MHLLLIPVYVKYLLRKAAAIAQSVQRLATGWAVRGSRPVGGEIFRARLERPRGRSSFLYNEYRVPFTGVKRPRRGVDHAPSPSAGVEYGQSYTSTYSQCVFGMLRDSMLCTQMCTECVNNLTEKLYQETCRVECSTVKHCRLQQKPSNVNDSVISTSCYTLYRAYSLHLSDFLYIPLTQFEFYYFKYKR